MCYPYGWVLGTKFSRQGPLFRQILLKQGWFFSEIDKRMSKMGSFPPKFIIKVCMTASLGDWKEVAL